MQRYFKTGKGDYGEGDVFVGVTSPETRSIANKYQNLSFDQIKILLNDEIHECRSTALTILVEQFKKADETQKKAIQDFYLENLDRVNNWDLVDTSAHYLVGELHETDEALFDRLSSSDNMWHRRVAMESTYHTIKKGNLVPAIRMASKLVTNTEDLMHKVVGWMLREVGKQDKKVLVKFLNENLDTISRTTLSYCTEKMTSGERAKWREKRQVAHQNKQASD
ncbi:putative DNA alkylation repair protein [Blattamonas nauphoetae]|uniref:DNA alkylation repair protein n=1 Tax=Blattamonas nauphoetae TaxID=2049346 RepID=A0ABQ9XNV4_9EUKA|nr:putative DNA alkylation repair protein [Blattamonas nauphoetae]